MISKLRWFVAGGAVLAAAASIVLRYYGEELPDDYVSRAPPVEAPAYTAPDSANLLRHLSILAHDSMQGRQVGTAGGAMARSYLVEQLTRLGVAPAYEGYEQPFATVAGAEARNVVGRVDGSSSGPAIVLTAHYDHEGVVDGEVYNGADDNASGTATLLEVARLIEVAPLRHTVLIALLDAEEVGLQGARAFVADPPLPLDQIALNINLDMVSRSGGVLWAAGAFHTPALRPILETVAELAPVTLRLGHDRPGAPEGADWTQMSDHGPFHESGIPFVYFGVEDHADYHRPTDDFERVDPGEFVNAARTIVLALHALDEGLPSLSPDDDR